MDILIDLKLKRKFFEYSRFPASNFENSVITLRQLDEWLKEAGILDMNNITTVDTGLLFFKLGTGRIGFKDLVHFLKLLCEEKHENYRELTRKMIGCEKSKSTAKNDDINEEVSEKTKPKGYISNIRKFYE